MNLKIASNHIFEDFLKYLKIKTLIGQIWVREMMSNPNTTNEKEASV